MQTRKSIQNLLIGSLAILLILVKPVVIQAQQDTIAQGVTYLLSIQNPDGTWSQDPQMFLDTYTALETLLLLEGLNTQTSLSLNWVRWQSLNNTDDLAHKIILLSLGGETVDTEIATLLTFQNSDNGWGADQDFLSDNLDTTLALQALAVTGSTDTATIDGVVNYLTSTQNPDGGWGFYQGDTSNIYMTSLVSWTLQKFPQTTSISTALNNATSYLISQQQVDGSWGSVYETAYAYIALVAVSTDATVLGGAIDYLTTTQSANGSWDDDPYSTALALRALHYSQNKPVLPPPPPNTGSASLHRPTGHSYYNHRKNHRDIYKQSNSRRRYNYYRGKPIHPDRP